MKLILSLLLAPVLFAQGPQRVEFEVASVRPAAPIAGVGAQTPAAAQLNPSQIRLTYLTMKDFITRAYGVKAYQVAGPDWLITERYDINATIPAGATLAQVPQMMQALLEDRFGLKMHRSQKEFAVYVLERSKRPFTLTEVQAVTPETAGMGVAPTRTGQGVALNLEGGGFFSFADSKAEGKRMSMDMLANTLTPFLGLPAINGSDIKGLYDFSFSLAPEDFSSMMMRAAVNRGVQVPPQLLAQLESMQPSSFFNALDKVGLKLEKSKAPLEVINIDELKKTPTEN